ncbi:Uncharacterized lipoprotein YbaY [Pseudomonas cuatrocienegasensis]|uniref:Uncharacterized lipoprotein YbaY n=1 Tax=Pseudomonas cuatrocienegasensis TaxID=543360 RepID=A0ABY1BE79_9PSED|nr:MULTISPECIES: YbaY family lipoprotein [Pseudomonas]OEC34705.1 hypothetical protein A7D25_12455 [Pseudomonas sp. 21C1]SEQ64517.1 Uncharacterized lipoprotein YbaY [Pseudomonas cuatrocienegasensis]
MLIDLNTFRPALRALALIGFGATLLACSSEPSQPQPPTAPTAPPAAPAPAEVETDYRHALSGQLLDVPANAVVELALLQVDERGRPQGLLGNIQVRSNGAALPFRLPFNPQAVKAERRVELHGRAHLDGRLILRLTPQTITGTDSQDLGALRLVSAP